MTQGLCFSPRQPAKCNPFLKPFSIFEKKLKKVSDK